MKGLIYILTGSLVLLSSCQKDSGNHPPVIDSITLDPSGNFTPGSDIAVSVIVEDIDQDELVFFWESDGGRIAAPGQQSTSWELYTEAEPLSFESIRVTVSDGKSMVSESRTIQVSEGLLMTGLVYYYGTSIPVEGVEITLGKFSTFSDENGHYVIEHLKEGNTQVTATKPGFDSFEAMVYVDHPKSTYHIPMTSPTMTGNISGVVKTIDDVMYEGLKVVLLNTDHTESEIYGYTDRFGSFTLENVPVGLRSLMIRNEANESIFLNDSMIYQINMDQSDISYDARIKIKRTLISDLHLSELDKWEFNGLVSDGFYQLGRGEHMDLVDYIAVPVDAERAMFYLDSYIIGGCNLVGKLPSHRVWISNDENKYLGGITWGGEGSNFSAEVSWYPSSPPTFINLYGKEIKFHLEVFEENSCVPNPLWRIFHLEFSYYY